MIRAALVFAALLLLVAPAAAHHGGGTFDGSKEIVDTVGLAPGGLSPPILNSDKLHVVERFSLDPNKNLLTRSYTAEDPVYFKGQFTGRMGSVWRTSRTSRIRAKRWDSSIIRKKRRSS